MHTLIVLFEYSVAAYYISSAYAYYIIHLLVPGPCHEYSKIISTGYQPPLSFVLLSENPIYKSIMNTIVPGYIPVYQ